MQLTLEELIGLFKNRDELIGQGVQRLREVEAEANKMRIERDAACAVANRLNASVRHVCQKKARR